MRALAIAISCSLAGCAHCPTPDPVVSPFTVKVPVPAPCRVDVPESPAMPTYDLPNGGLYLKGTALLKELEAYRVYSEQLRGLLIMCSEPLR